MTIFRNFALSTAIIACVAASSSATPVDFTLTTANFGDVEVVIVDEVAGGNTAIINDDDTLDTTTAFQTGGGGAGVFDERTISEFGIDIAAPITTGIGFTGVNDLNLEANGSSERDNAPALRTTATGLDPGALVEVFVLSFVRNDGTLGGSAFIDAAITGNDFERIGAQPDVDAGQATLVAGETLAVAASNVFDLAITSLGITTVDGAGAFSVDVAASVTNALGTVPTATRTNFTGIAFRIVPEPTTIALLGLALPCMVTRRRK